VNSYPSTSYPRDPVVIESSLMTPSQPFDMIRTPIHSSHSVMNRIPNNLETPMFRSSPTILNLSALNHSHGYYRLTQRINLSTFSDTSSKFSGTGPNYGNLIFLTSKTNDLDFKIYYQNVRGTRTKLKELVCAIPLVDYDVIVFTETWLKSYIYDSELGLDDFSIYRCDRETIKPNSEGGGVLIAVRKRFSSQLINIVNDSVETLFIKIQINKTPLILNAVYIPPSSSSDHYGKYVDLLDQVLLSHLDSVILLAGDYNAPSLTWSFSDDLKWLLSEGPSSSSDILINSTACYGLNQYNHIRNSLDRTLDLVFVNYDSVVVGNPYDVLLPIDGHHPPLLITLKIKANHKISLPSNKQRIFSFRKTNFELLREYL
ncbi:uncharacterized protein LOC113473035, partial [Diaphorina citri]|uniref:Uncharacterized protein LOC113473035 n=1 Tax=Diaphorina citri TaxID=121845 RepID=A0A3Q0JJQ6_DIACI